MKHIFTSLLLGATMLLSSFTLQSSSIDEVIGALRSGNASQLSNYFDENVGLTLPDKSDSYSKAQAQLIVKDFFSNNGVKGFELKHKGDGTGGSQYCVGTLQTSAGNYRTNVFMKMKNGKEVVKEIRFQSMD
ncbi:MAG: DUF4783 domain-containing protein [Chitinophagaceae bacterium]|nr:DUF4783 domain-containing protein [Chitinophagaceae bacterium]MBK7291100.1 DUF4783 domain-containing protein [Chitinophagaceae bacterium]MBK8310014.1 DUF4783 domain-containing protein [Chitinophagaceae bacterium]MBK8607182.1 DUF4783 domain-containing protein [Chitinophagaceae bacterium]MBP6476858.1 DUF4783 domain-containing protein [Chitinophagaceae bacterium]